MKQQIKDIFKELERLEHTLNFSVYYTLEKFESSPNHFTPGFDLEGYYYEFRGDSKTKEYSILVWRYSDEGEALTLDELNDLLEELRKVESLVVIPTTINGFRQLGVFEDAVAYWFKLNYNDVELYSLTVEDAYRSPSVKILNKEELDLFLKDF